jgi:hypothetical protein
VTRLDEKVAVVYGGGASSSHYRWVTVAAGGLLGCVAIGAMFSLPVFLVPISRDTGWSATGVSGATTIGFLAMALASMVWGTLSDRLHRHRTRRPPARQPAGLALRPHPPLDRRRRHLEACRHFLPWPTRLRRTDRPLPQILGVRLHLASLTASSRLTQSERGGHVSLARGDGVGWRCARLRAGHELRGGRRREVRRRPARR